MPLRARSELPNDCFALDALMDSLEEYDEGAQDRAAKRRKKAHDDGRRARKNCRGGKTATMPIYYGYVNFRKVLGLPVLTPPELKEVAKAGPGMPAVGSMMSAATFRALERATADESRSSFERAFSGGGWLEAAASTRTKDMQRTAKINVVRTQVLGSETLVACGVAKRSKARSQKQMRPLAWRAPLIPIGDGEVDLEPLLESMPDSEDGCVFRDFDVPKGKPHSIVHAIAWRDRPASHATVVRSLRDIAEDPDLDGHDARHIMPEVGRGLRMPRHQREALGYWAAETVVADSADDPSAFAAAVRLARKKKTRMGALASNADRYSSVAAAPVEQDATRATCLLALKEVVETWGAHIPESCEDQISAIMAANDAASTAKMAKMAKKAAKKAATEEP